MVFSKISSIRIEDPKTWLNKIFLTIDIDWACDDILEYTINIIEQANVYVTWFITHETKLLDRLRYNSKFELGIHPNFNFLLDGNSKNGKNAEEVLNRLLDLVPSAISVRSHSLTQNSRILQLFHDKGLIYDCNHFIPEQANMILKPWALWNGLIKVPHFWEDDLASLYNHKTPFLELIKREGLKVFDFHPIHIFLNMDNLSLYEKTRSIHYESIELAQHRQPGEGVHTMLNTLLNVTTL